MPKQKKSSRLSKPRYRLEVSQRQAQLISNAVELYARLGMGQYVMLEYFFWGDLNALEKARPHLNDLQIIKNEAFHGKKLDDAFRILYDIHQVVRYRLAIDRPQKKKMPWSVDCRDPLQTSSVQPLAKIEPIDSK